MTRTEILEMLKSVGVSAKADTWTDTLIEMPDGIFYGAEDFTVGSAYWQDGQRIEAPVLAYNGEAEFNTVFWPLPNA